MGQFHRSRITVHEISLQWCNKSKRPIDSPKIYLSRHKREKAVVKPPHICTSARSLTNGSPEIEKYMLVPLVYSRLLQFIFVSQFFSSTEEIHLRLTNEYLLTFLVKNWYNFASNKIFYTKFCEKQFLKIWVWKSKYIS